MIDFDEFQETADSIDEDLANAADLKDYVESNKSLSSLFRQELEEYLDDLNHLISSDGKPLVTVPENFDSIVNAMTRDDLAAPTEDNAEQSTKPPWFKYLIQDQVNKQFTQEYAGRYDNLIDSSRDEKIRKGMAEILMLDRQLWMLTKKAQQLAKDENDQDFNDPSADSVPDTPGTERTRDRTFLTKAGDSKSSFDPNPRSGRQSTKSSARSSPDKDSIGNEDIDYKPDQEEERKKVTVAIDNILEMDDESFEKAMSYIPTSVRIEEDDIEKRLCQYGRLDRLSSLLDNTQQVIKEPIARDFLAQQRQERKQKEYENQIDSLLEKYSTSNSDFSALISSDLSSPRSGLQTESRSTYSKALHEVPSVEEVSSRVNVPITREDICLLVENLKKVLIQGNNANKLDNLETNSSHDEYEVELLPDLATQDQIESLLEQYSNDLERMKQLRSSMESLRPRDVIENPAKNKTPREYPSDLEFFESKVSDNDDFSGRLQSPVNSRPFSPSDLSALKALEELSSFSIAKDRRQFQESGEDGGVYDNFSLPPIPSARSSREGGVRQSAGNSSSRTTVQPSTHPPSNIPVLFSRRVKQKSVPKQNSKSNAKKSPRAENIYRDRRVLEQVVTDDFEEMEEAPSNKFQAEKRALLDQIRMVVDC